MRVRAAVIVVGVARVPVITFLHRYDLRAAARVLGHPDWRTAEAVTHDPAGYVPVVLTHARASVGALAHEATHVTDVLADGEGPEERAGMIGRLTRSLDAWQRAVRARGATGRALRLQGRRSPGGR
jgi:hypothetical protein